MAGYPKLQKAVRVACKAHKKQKRDDNDPLPYITHPVDVLNLLRYEANVQEEDVLCAAMLHDLLEETDVTAKEIEKEFGKAVHDLVKELTREEPDATMRKLPEKELWKIRSDAMMLEIDRMSPSAKKIKLADRCSNLGAAFRTKEGEKLERYMKQSHAILEHIDRSICPELWDRIQRMLSTADAAQPPKRKNLKENGAAKKPVA